MLLQNSPFRDLDSLFDFGRSVVPAPSRAMPMDAYRRDDNVWVHIDLPGVAADSIDISVERNVLTVTAERNASREDGDRMYLAERHRGTFRRQVNLGEGLDADGIEADYHDGVLTLRVPVAQQAKPRKIEIRNSGLQVDAADPAIETVSSEGSTSA